MVTNEYDALLADVSNSGELPVDSGNAPADPAAQAMAAVAQEDKAALQQSMFLASKANPDRHAEVVRIAQKKNLPSFFVEKNFDALKEVDSRQADNYDSMIRDNPGLSAWLTNPDNAALAKDDLEPLKGVEQAIKDRTIYGDMYQALLSGMATTNANIAKVPGLIYDTAAIPQNLAIKAGLLSGPQVSSKTLGDQLGISNGVAEYYDEAGKSFAPPEMSQSITDLIGKGDYRSAGKTLALQFVNNAPQQAVMLLSGLGGATKAGLVVAGTTSAASANSENLAAGAEPLQATGNALAKGTIEAGFESLGTFSLLHHWENAIATNFGKSTSKEVMKDFAKTMAYSFAGEANEEAMTSLAQDFTDYITGINPDALKGLGSRALDAGLVGGFSGGLMSAPATIATGVARAKREAAMNRDTYLNIGKQLEASKLRSRMPEAQAEYVKSLTEGTDIENVFIPVEAMEAYFQSNGSNPVGIAAELGIAQAFDEAKETGGPVKIPFSQWTAKVVGTKHFEALQNDVKFSPEAQTLNEIRADETQAQADVAEADAAATALKEAGIVEDTAPQVNTEFAQLLRNTGKFKEEQISQYAAVVEERYRARAENRGLGESAIDLFRNQNLRIQQGEALPPDTDFPFGANIEEEIASLGDYAEGQAMLREAAQGSRSDLLQMARVALDNIPDVSTDNVAEALGLPKMAVRALSRGGRTGAKVQTNYSKEEIMAAVAQGNSSFDQSAVATELDQSVEARKARAEEMGFDTSKVYYHGTNADFDSFDISKAGSRRDEGFLGKGLYFSSDSKVVGKDDSIAIPAYLKAENSLRLQMQTFGDDKRLLVRRALDLPSDASAADVSQALEEKGYDSVILDYSPTGYTHQEVAVLSAAQIRSVNAEFDPAQADSPNILYQSGATPRGRIQFGRSSSLIELFDGHDASTVLHESGHLWFEELMVDATEAGTNPNLAKDLDTILEWAGLDVRARDGYAAVKAAVQTEQHEMFARGFEAYLMEGKAPSQALRKVFARFKLWLTRIYRNVRQLNVELTPDVRRVFDRLLVAESELSLAENELAFDPLFTDPQAMGMNDIQAAKYEKARADAHQAAMDKLSDRLFEDLRRERDSWWKEEKARTRAEVEAEVAGDQRYQSLEILQKGELADGTPIKLDRDSIEREYGKDFLKKLPRPVVYAKEGGLHHSMVAEKLGFESGDDLLVMLANLQKPKEYITQETERRMAEDYPELMDDANLRQTAKNLAMSEDRAKVLRMELEHLASNNLPVLKDAIRRVTKRVPTEKAVRAQAEKMIQSKAVGELSPRIYQAAGVKAAKEAGVLLAKGDFEGAFEAKRKELLNLELHRAATAAQEQVDKSLENFKKLRRKDEDLGKTREVDLVNAARAILSRFGLGPKTDKTADEYLSPIKTYDPESYGNLVEIVNGAAQNAMPYKQMSYQDFLAVSDMFDAMWEMSKSLKTMEVDGQKITRDEAIAAISDRVAELNAGAGPAAGTTQTLTDSEKRSIGLRSVLNLSVRVEAWARGKDKGDINGPFTKYIVRPIMEATTRYRAAKDVKLEELKKIVQSLKIENPEAKIASSELGFSFTKPELLMAILHTGNDSNKRKLLLGRGWATLNADGTLNTQRWDKFMARMTEGANAVLGKAEFDFAQSIWDLNESLKPDAQRAHKKMYGSYFNEVTADKFETPFGEYKGGYMPAVADADISVDTNIRAGQSQDESPAQMFPTTGRGFTKARQENYTTPLSLDFGKIQSHIDKVLKFTYIEPTVKETARLVNNRTLRQTLNNYDVGIANDLLIPYLKRAATQTSTTPGMSKWLDKGIATFRRSTSMQFMALNVVNAIQNTTGMFPAMTMVGPKHMAGAFTEYLKGPKAYTEMVTSTSAFMKQRLSSTSLDAQKAIDDVILDPGKFQKISEAAINISYAMDRATNGMMEVSVWGAAFNQALAKGSEEKEAINLADAAVRQTLMGGNPEDLARFETGSPFVKLFTMFSGFFNTQSNLLRTEFTIAKEEGFTSKEGAARAAKAAALVIYMPAIVSALIARTLAGEGMDSDDDGKYFDDILDIFFAQPAKYLMAMAPGGTLVNTAINQFNSKPFDDKINLSPAISNLEKVFHAPVSLYKVYDGKGGEAKAIRESFTALGMATGLPIAPLAKPIGYIADVKEGKAKPTGMVDFTRGLMTGRTGAPSK